MPPQDGYGLGIFNLAGWIGHNGSLPGYQTVAVYLPEKQTTMVILTNTDIESQGAEPSTTLAAAITKELTPDHIYTLSPKCGARRDNVARADNQAPLIAWCPKRSPGESNRKDGRKWFLENAR